MLPQGSNSRPTEVITPQTAIESYRTALVTTPLRPTAGIEIASRLEEMLAEREHSNPAPHDVGKEGEEDDSVGGHDVENRGEHINYVCRSTAMSLMRQFASHCEGAKEVVQGSAIQVGNFIEDISNVVA